MKSIKKQLALLLAMVMLITAIPTTAQAAPGDMHNDLHHYLANATPHNQPVLFTGDGFTVATTVHSSWATGHNAMFAITNTSSQP